MNERVSAEEKGVKRCAECPMCRYTRNCRSKTVLYRLARLIQKTCPNCHSANEALGKNFQKSRHF